MADTRHYRLGLIHRPHPRLIRLADHVSLDDLTAPSERRWSKAIALDGDPLGNDVHGNCVECGALRYEQVIRAVAAGDTSKPTATMALDLYRKWAGWDGTEATDIGTPSDVAAKLWLRDGIRWSPQLLDVPPMLVWVDPHNLDHLRVAMDRLGPIQMDLALPVSTEDQQDEWRLVPGPAGQQLRGYHRVCFTDYDGTRFYAVTWGGLMAIDPAFVRAYAVNAEAVVSRYWLKATGQTVEGLDLDRLESIAHAIAM